MRAFANAGLEFAAAVAFLLLVALGLVAIERFGFPIQIGTLSGEITMHFWESEDDRLQATQAALKEKLPPGSSFEVQELFVQPDPVFNQTIVATVTYPGLPSYFDFISLTFDLPGTVGGHQGAAFSKIKRVEGPGQVITGISIMLILLPYMALRIALLPANSPPVKPLLPSVSNCRRTVVLCMAIGLLLGIVAPALFMLGETLGALTFSDRMPDLNEMMEPVAIWWTMPLLVAVAGAAEEAFFRGLVLRRFVQQQLPLLGLLFCAFWFTAFHASYFSWDSGNIVYAFWILAAGLGLGLLTLRLHSWVPAAIVHASYNFSVTLVAGIGSLAQG